MRTDMRGDPAVRDFLEQARQLDNQRQAALLVGIAEMLSRTIDNQERRIAILYNDLDRAGLTARSDE